LTARFSFTEGVYAEEEDEGGGTVMLTKTVVPDLKERVKVVVSSLGPDTSTVAFATGSPRGRL
jgi:hypothetical protein